MNRNKKICKNDHNKIEKYFKNSLVIIPIVLSFASFIVSIISVRITVKESNKNELILKPRFSLEKNEDLDEDGSFVWKICNLGGAISNATIYPRMYVVLSYFNEDTENNVDITFEFIDYYSDNFYYRNSDGTFYVKDDKQKELYKFIDEYDFLSFSDGYFIGGYKIIPCFILHYDDYKGNFYNTTYTIVSDEINVDNSEYSIFGDTMDLLEEISEIPKPDIVLPLKPDSQYVVSIYYQDAQIKQLVNNKHEYDPYLHSIVLDMIRSNKEKSVEELLGY